MRDLACFALVVALVAAGAVTIAPVALAQTTVEGTAPPSPEPLEDMTIDELIESIVLVITDWRTTGWLAGLIALINLLIHLLRLPALDRWLRQNGLTWIKPAAAAVLGGILTALVAYLDGAAIGGAAVAGVLVGLSATGLHELFTAPRRARARTTLYPPPGARR